MDYAVLLAISKADGDILYRFGRCVAHLHPFTHSLLEPSVPTNDPAILGPYFHLLSLVIKDEARSRTRPAS